MNKRIDWGSVACSAAVQGVDPIRVILIFRTALLNAGLDMVAEGSAEKLEDLREQSFGEKETE